MCGFPLMLANEPRTTGRIPGFVDRLKPIGIAKISLGPVKSLVKELANPWLFARAPPARLA